MSMLRGAATSAPELAVSPSIAIALPPIAESLFFLVSDSSWSRGDQKEFAGLDRIPLSKFGPAT